MKVGSTAELVRPPKLHGTFGKANDFAVGDYGHAILSRFAVGESKIRWLPGEPNRERPIAFEAIIDCHGRKIRLVTTRLHHASDEFRQRQAEKLNEFNTVDTTFMILAGDPNARPDSQPLKFLKTQRTVANSAEGLPSFPAGQPNRLIDDVIYKPATGFAVIEQRVIDEPVASGHRHVVVES